MKLILKRAVENLGESGEVVSVKAGYARNYLLPQGLAYEASEANLARIEEEQRLSTERARRDYLEGRRRAAQLEGKVLTFQARAAEEGRLFGSVAASDIVERLNDGSLDFEVSRKQVLLEEPIKEIGIYHISLSLITDVQVEVEVRVEREED